MTPAKFAKLVDQTRKAEADMRRAFRRWEKFRTQMARAEKALEKDFARRAEKGVGGEGDWRELAKLADPDLNDDLPERL